MHTLPVLALTLLIACALWHEPAQASDDDWTANWAIPPGYSLEVDSSGYTLPVSIAMVPNPGSEPTDPAYFVAELGGRILAVRNDRKIDVFAERFFELNMTAQMPELSGVLGMTGLCLDSDTGYLFATYVYDSPKGRYNGITRFSTKAKTFALKPSKQLHIRKPFQLGDSSFTRFPFGHQIGQCQIIDDTLFVGIGDGELTHRPRSDQSSFGKIIRMRFDGSPVSGQSMASATLADYIYASGLRNPFGQTSVGGNIVVADNGPGIDRVLHVREGRDYLYDGSDDSIATNAMVIYAPAKGTAHTEFYPASLNGNLPQLSDNLLVVLSGVPEVYVEEEPPEISIFKLEPDTLHVSSRPKSLVRYIGKQLQVLSSVAIAKDGIYFAPVYSENATAGPSNLYKLSPANKNSYPNLIGQYRNPRAILRDNGCRGCHKIKGDGGNIGPTLNPDEIRQRHLARVNTPEYERFLNDLNVPNTPKSLMQARKRILSVTGEKRLTFWLQEKILDPTVDNDHSIMPQLNLSKNEAKAVTRFLLKNKKKSP
ncbi:MAG: PQQ-dependent sugar dehydrogenase [Halioglobus sp.]